MGKRTQKIEEYFIGKKVDKKLISDCKIDFKNTNLFNAFSIMKKGGNGVVGCDFHKGDDFLGHLDLYFNLSKNGLTTRVESSKGLLMSLAKEIDITEKVLGL